MRENFLFFNFSFESLVINRVEERDGFFYKGESGSDCWIGVDLGRFLVFLGRNGEIFSFTVFVFFVK